MRLSDLKRLAAAWQLVELAIEKDSKIKGIVAPHYCALQCESFGMSAEFKTDGLKISYSLGNPRVTVRTANEVYTYDFTGKWTREPKGWTEIPTSPEDKYDHRS